MIGIGSQSPSHKLDIHGTNSLPGISKVERYILEILCKYFKKKNVFITFSRIEDNVTGPRERLFIFSNGNVGIGV